MVKRRARFKVRGRAVPETVPAARVERFTADSLTTVQHLPIPNREIQELEYGPTD